MPRTRALFTELTGRGPHHVLRGDLAFAGLPGVVYTPDSGLGLAGVAFGHDWLTGVDHYRGTLEHLASWGIVAAAPDTERGLVPSVLNLASDLGTALEIVAGVRLGPGKISVHPKKLGLVGHGFGASAAVLTASERASQGAGQQASWRASQQAAAGSRDAMVGPQAVAAVFPTVTKPPAEDFAQALTIPGLILTAPGAELTLRSDAAELARAWDGAALRIVKKAKPAGFAEGRRLTRLVGLPTSDTKTQKVVRALLTGYLLYELTADKTYREFADPDAHLPHTQPIDELPEPAPPEDKAVALLKS